MSIKKLYKVRSNVAVDFTLTTSSFKLDVLIDNHQNFSLSNTEISEILGVCRGTVIKSINKLIQKGYIERIFKDGKRYLHAK